MGHREYYIILYVEYYIFGSFPHTIRQKKYISVSPNHIQAYSRKQKCDID